MKLAVIGGGGVRSPFLARSLARSAAAIGLTDLVFMDRDPEKLRAFGGLSRRVVSLLAPGLELRLTTSLPEAVRGADYVITTMRVGGDEGRAADEALCRRLGILGQETTGAGGFAMALRTVPAMLEVCAAVESLAAPGAVVFNFTNPAGLVTQALRDSGHSRVYGVCDAPSGLLKGVARLLGRAEEGLEASCVGLNHLSFFTSLRSEGVDLLPGLLGDPRLYAETDMRYFEPALARRKGLLLNEYLYYYYYPEKALANIASGGEGRGARIARINRDMAAELRGLDTEAGYDTAVAIYERGHGEREADYMARETGARRRGPAFRFDPFEADEGGYAGVALAFVRAKEAGIEGEMVLCLPNEGAIPWLSASDVVEVSCRIGPGGARPKATEALPEAEAELVRRVKAYERLASRAILSRSRNLATEALFLNPLVASESIAAALVAAFESEGALG